MKAAGLFTQQLWEAVDPIYQQIVSCRFVRDLAAGTLSKERFAHYLTQDILYLNKDAEALGNVSRRAQNNEESLFFRRLQEDGLEVEYVLRNEYLRYFNLQAATTQSKAFEDYSKFLLKHSLNSAYEVACAALLPCFWIYGAVGDVISEANTVNNPYQKFTDTYAGEEYEFYTRRFIEIVEENLVKTKLKTEMMEAFVQAAKHELNVFEEAGNLIISN